MNYRQLTEDPNTKYSILLHFYCNFKNSYTSNNLNEYISEFCRFDQYPCWNLIWSTNINTVTRVTLGNLQGHTWEFEPERAAQWRAAHLKAKNSQITQGMRNGSNSLLDLCTLGIWVEGRHSSGFSWQQEPVFSQPSFVGHIQGTSFYTYGSQPS